MSVIYFLLDLILMPFLLERVFEVDNRRSTVVIMLLLLAACLGWMAWVYPS